MIKLIVYFLLSVLLFIWLSHNNGTINIDWLGYKVSIELIFFIPAIILLKLIILKLVLLSANMRQQYKYEKYSSAIANIVNGLSYVKIGDKISASSCSTQAQKYLPQIPIMKFLEANVLMMQGKTQCARKCLIEIVDKDQILRPTALNQLLAIAYQSNDMLEVENVTNRIATLFPKEPWSLLQQGEFYCHTEHYGKAITLFKKIKKYDLELEYDLNRRISILYYAIAEKSYMEEKYDEALQYLNQAYNDNIVGLILLKAKIYNKLNKNKKALSLLESAYKETPHVNICNLYADCGGNINKECFSSIPKENEKKSWQCTKCYTKHLEWYYVCSKCNQLDSILWI